MFQAELFEDNIKQESPFQSEVSFEMPGIEQDGHSSYVSSGYDQRNLGYATSFGGLPNDFSTLSSGNHITHVSNVENSTSGTGIIIRKRQIPNQSTVQSSAPHGTAPRRIRLQKKLQVGPVQCGLPKESTNPKIALQGDSAQVRCLSHLSLLLTTNVFVQLTVF